MHAMYLGHGDGEAEIGKAMICIERQRDVTRGLILDVILPMHKEKGAACRPGLLVICQAVGKNDTAEARGNSGLQMRSILCDTRRLEAVALGAGWLYVEGGPRGDRSNATRIRSGFTRPIRPARDRDYLVKCGAQLASALEAAIRCLGEGFSNYIVNVWRDIWT